MGSAKIAGRAIGFGKSKKALQGSNGGNTSPIPGGADYAAQQSAAFEKENAGTNKVMDDEPFKQPFKLPTNGLRNRSGALYMAGTAIALASTSIYAFSSAGQKSASGGKFITKIPRYIAGGTAGAVAQPVKAMGRGIKKVAVNSGVAIKESTHGTYTAKKEHDKNRISKNKSVE